MTAFFAQRKSFKSSCVFGPAFAKLTAQSVRKIKKFFRMLLPPERPAGADFIQIHSHHMPIIYRQHPRAKTYVLRIHPNKTVVVTMPRRGSKKFAQDFVTSRKAWLEKHWKIMEGRKLPPQILRPGMEIYFRGRPMLLELEKQNGAAQLRLGSELLCAGATDGNLRPVIETHLQRLAQIELVERVQDLAVKYEAVVNKIVVRSQKSRWGSCSQNGTISLNWRLIQLPPEVCDYIIIHELMHLRELNHSRRFWAHVAKSCPNYLQAEEWLKHNSGCVGF